MVHPFSTAETTCCVDFLLLSISCLCEFPANLLKFYTSLSDRSSLDEESWLLPAKKRADTPRTRRIINEIAIKILLMFNGPIYVNIAGIS
jgi:hypothetical protein